MKLRMTHPSLCNRGFNCTRRVSCKMLSKPSAVCGQLPSLKNVVPGLKIAFKKANGGTINCAVRFFVTEGVNVHGLIITNS